MVPQAARAFQSGGTAAEGIFSLVRSMVQVRFLNMVCTDGGSKVCPAPRVIAMVIHKATLAYAQGRVDFRLGLGMLFRSPLWEMLTEENRCLLGEVAFSVLGDYIQLDIETYLERCAQRLPRQSLH